MSSTYNRDCKLMMEEPLLSIGEGFCGRPFPCYFVENLTGEKP